MKILIKTVAGSHLFGTNTEESDMDYKGVFLPSPKDILLNNYKDTISQSTGNSSEKNNSTDVDIEFYSLKKFLKMAKRGDTAALELLFTPDDFIIEKDPLWDFIIENRSQLLSSKVTGMIGYARQQANKYGIKGSRMGELNNFIVFLKKLENDFDFENPKLKHSWETICKEVKTFDHINLIELELNESKIPALDILGKKFDHHCTFPYVLGVLKKIYKSYGQRAREAKNNNGIDWKALSHAVRVMYQGIELLDSHEITLPLPPTQLEIVKKIKSGEMQYNDVSVLIEYLLKSLETIKNKSSLGEEIDDDIIENIILKMHMEQLKGFSI